MSAPQNCSGIRSYAVAKGNARWMMKFITRGGKGREDENEDRKATRSEGRGLEESASRTLMRGAR